MRYQEYLLSSALGVILCDDFLFPGHPLLRGHKLTAKDIDFLKGKGIDRIFGAELDDSDIVAETVLEVVAARLAGKGTAYQVDERGQCRIVASRDGILFFDRERLEKFNRFSENLILNPSAPCRPVKSDEIIARLELTIPAMSSQQLDNLVLRLSGNGALLNVIDDYPRKTAFVYTRLYNDETENARLTGQVTALIKDFAAYGLDFSGEYNARHETESIADMIQQAADDGYELIFVVPCQRTSSREDVIPSALNKYVDEIISPAFPAVGCSDLLIAAKRRTRIISLPFAYAGHNHPALSEDIAKAILLEKLNAFEFHRRPDVFIPSGEFLSEEEQTHLIKSSGRGSDSAAEIAVVILAAGVSSRAKRNKLLLEDQNGRPLFMNAVYAALKSKASPVFLITGHQHEELEHCLEDIDINVVYNSDYRSGIKTSINLGLRLVPSSCDGAILLPADMPEITPALLDKMIAAFDRKQPRQVVMLSYKGVKFNPVLWSSSLFSEADLVPENAHVRAVFMEHEDYTRLVKIPAKDKNLLFDVTYPADIETVEKKNK